MVNSMLSNFLTTTHGKWILCGEHAVLRGHPALVFPLLDKTLHFQYTNSSSLCEFSSNTDNTLNIHASYLGRYDAKISAIISEVVDKAFDLVNLNKQTVSGTIEIHNNIETGLGMGSSAALCVAIARWFANANFIQDTYTFAKTLENFFHGQSSGLDIAGVETGRGIYFQQGRYTEIQEAWQPIWKLSASGESGKTAKCIAKVNELWQKDKVLAEKIDLNMQKSVELAKSSLENNNNLSFNNLVQAIEIANNCFQKWGLITETMQTHMQSLLNKGAKAVKPTGSGGGGLIVSLWEK